MGILALIIQMGFLLSIVHSKEFTPLRYLLTCSLLKISTSPSKVNQDNFSLYTEIATERKLQYHSAGKSTAASKFEEPFPFIKRHS